MSPTWLHWAAGAGGGGWLPSDLASLAGWYKADGIVGLSDSDPVASWADASAASNNLTPSAGTPASGYTSPTYKASVLNGMAVVGFPAGTDRLAAAIDLADNFMVGYLMRFVTTSGGTSKTAWTTESTSGQRNGPNAAHFWHSSTLRSYSAGSGTQYQSVSALAAGDWHLLIETRDGGGGSGLRKVNLDGTNMVAVSDADSNIQRGVLAFGRGIFSAGDIQIAEAAVCTATPSASDVQKMEGYLAHKWGLTANLPLGHPYKVTEP